jgi:hypothetical protein
MKKTYATATITFLTSTTKKQNCNNKCYTIYNLQPIKKHKEVYLSLRSQFIVSSKRSWVIFIYSLNVSRLRPALPGQLTTYRSATAPNISHPHKFWTQGRARINQTENTSHVAHLTHPPIYRHGHRLGKTHTHTHYYSRTN